MSKNVGDDLAIFLDNYAKKKEENVQKKKFLEKSLGNFQFNIFDHFKSFSAIIRTLLGKIRNW